MKTPRDMMMALLILALLPAVAGCGRQEAPPAPVPIDDQASGYFCGMLVLAHPGPKAQIWIAGRDHPLWFTSVRDAFSYLQAGEREGRIIAFYVQDMGRAESWAHPGRDFFIPADRALYVWGSDRKGGMGAPELVPFALRADAEDFVARHGGRILSYAQARRLPLLGMTPAPAGGVEGAES